MRLPERVEHLAIVLDLIGVDQARDGRRVDGVDPDECLGELTGQRLSGVLVERVFAQDLAGRRLAGDMRQDHVRAPESAGSVDAVTSGRRRNSGDASGADGGDLGRHVADVALALTLQDQRSSIGLESPRVARCPTRQTVSDR